jgi:hypothetical protein
MNQDIKVGIKGRYIFTDPKNQKPTRIIDNIITNGGLRRFAGASTHFAYNFWWNMRYLFLGQDNSTESPTDFEMGLNYIPNNPTIHGDHFTPPVPIPAGTEQFFMKHASVDPDVGGVMPWHSAPYDAASWDNAMWTTPTGLYWWPQDLPAPHGTGGYDQALNSMHFSKFPQLVGTTYLRDPITGWLIIRFSNTWHLKFNRNIEIYEVGVGPIPVNSGDNVQIVCGGTEPYLKDVKGKYWHTSSSGTNNCVDGGCAGSVNRLGHQAGDKHSIFSRTTLNPFAFFNQGDETTVTYQCDVMICPSIEMLENFPFVVSAGGAVTDALPDNRTTMRQCPFFKMPGNARIGNFGNAWILTNRPSKASYGSAEDQMDDAICTPLLDNMHTPHKGAWVLDFYRFTGARPYNTITRTLTADHISDSSLLGVTQGRPYPNPMSSTFIKKANAPGATSPVPPKPNTFLKRIPPVSVVSAAVPGDPNAYTTTITFQVRSDSWLVGGTGVGEDIHSFALWRPINTNHQVYDIWRLQNGYQTFLKNVYTPTAGKWIVLKYVITWTRM